MPQSERCRRAKPPCTRPSRRPGHTHQQTRAYVAVRKSWDQVPTCPLCTSSLLFGVPLSFFERGGRVGARRCKGGHHKSPSKRTVQEGEAPLHSFAEATWSQWSGRRAGRHRPAWLQRGSKLLIQTGASEPGHRDPAISNIGVTAKRRAALIEGRAPTGPTSPTRDTRREASRRACMQRC